MAATVLVIDEDISIGKSLTALLQNHGFHTETAQNAEQASYCMTNKAVDALICALNTVLDHPLSTVALFKRLHPHAPVIVVAGEASGDRILQALELGVDDYFVQPLASPEILLRIVKKALKHGELKKENERYQHHLECTNAELSRRLEELRADQQAGRELQMRMLPEPFVLNDIAFAHRILPALFLSGDFLDYFKISEHQVGFYIADVSGHGSSSAFVTILIKKLVQQLRRQYINGQLHDILNPAAVLSFINTDLESSHLDKYATLFYGVLDTQSLTLTYSVGGHLPMPVLYANGKAEFLTGQGMAVGLFPEAKFQNYQHQLSPYFHLLLFSDGILERMQQAQTDKEQQLLTMVETAQGELKPLLKQLGLEQELELTDDISIVEIGRG